MCAASCFLHWFLITGVCALCGREAVAATMQQLAGSAATADEQHALEGLHLQPYDVAQRLLPLLLPSTSQPQLAYVAAMLQPFAGYSSSSGDEDHAAAALSLKQWAAAAAECAAAERELASRPAAEALQGLRQAAAALASRSLDLAAAFAAADGQQLPLGQLVRLSCRAMCIVLKMPGSLWQLACLRMAEPTLAHTLRCCLPSAQGVLLQRLYPGATADEARRLLAVVTAGGSGPGVVTLPALKAALARVQMAQQFPVSWRRAVAGLLFEV